ncbi:MAG: hypothetical protein ABL892_10965 [Thiobacillaceae bacterium]
MQCQGVESTTISQILSQSEPQSEPQGQVNHRGARARGMTDIAKASSLIREALYRALRTDAQLRFDNRQPGLRGAGSEAGGSTYSALTTVLGHFH